MKRVGDRIRRLRKDKGLSQEQLAELSGLHTNYVGQVERGEKNLTIETLQKVVGGLGVSLEEFFRYLDPMDRKDALSRVVEMLLERSVEDQTMALSLLKSVFEWEQKKYNL
ncbi:helix-turn-helix domain-containing protein [Paenibacillus sp. sgz5001063]|uniref:helix-turn-helix domain-containing protein n=1 Tax=Paenibacillus sp. sgz5001063 TaxID=3242474 RepID=UPI0036D37A4A